MTEFIQKDETVLRGPTRTSFDFGDFDHHNIPLQEEQYPVIIIGSSMVGMTLSILLGYYGIKSISFDRHPSTATHPRAALFLLRTMEVFRQLGLDKEMNLASASNFDLDAGMLIVEQLVGGKVIARMQEADPTQTAKITPCKRLWLTQDMFEPLLRREAHRFGANQRFATRIVHYEEQDDGVIVIAQSTETGHYSKYKTQYLVACDGNRSATRRKENIEWNGPGIFGNNLSINFQADLVPFLGSRAVHGVTYVNNKNVSAGFRLESGGKRGFMIVARLGERDDFEPDSITEQEAKRAFSYASGLEESDIALQIESISYWSVAALNSERYSTKKGRVFLAGDAAHIMPPTGGMGGNTGILDAHNLAWKLAYVINGNASSSLLGSYNTERQPAAGQTMQQAFSRLANRVLSDKSIPHDKELSDDICELGYRYPDGAFVYGERSSSEVWEDPYHPSALPGARMPHVSLVDRTRKDDSMSTVDLVKSRFVLFVTGSHASWCAAVSAQRLPLDVYEISESSSPIYDPTGRFSEVYKLDADEGILIRPDGLIAWRGIARSEKTKTASLKAVLKQILGM